METSTPLQETKHHLTLETAHSFTMLPTPGRTE